MNLDRRQLLGGTAALGLCMLAGTGVAAAATAKPAMVMYRSAGCGCCLKWADLARAAGYPLEVENVADIMALKGRMGVPQALIACHTTKVGDYVIEGHVPFEAIEKLLSEKPRGVAGIAVPGMPAGAPGMDMGGAHSGHSAAIEVLAFTSAGESRTFAY